MGQLSSHGHNNGPPRPPIPRPHPGEGIFKVLFLFGMLFWRHSYLIHLETLRGVTAVFGNDCWLEYQD